MTKALSTFCFTLAAVILSGELFFTFGWTCSKCFTRYENATLMRLLFEMCKVCKGRRKEKHVIL